jgi:hypothetical protein
MLTIAILSGVGVIASIIRNSMHDKIDVDSFLAAILVISTWNVLPLAISILAIILLIGVIGSMYNKK